MRFFQSLRLFHFVLVVAACPFLILAGCDDDPVRPVNTLPACWKPLVADTIGLPDPAPGFAQSAPAWSHSGNQVGYVSGYDSCNNPDPGIYIADSQGGARRRKLAVSGPFFKWLPGDTQLIVNTGFFVGGELVIYNLNTDSITPLGIQTHFPTFDISDDGRYIYYEGQPAPQHQISSIYEYDRVTKSEWAVVSGTAPAISPDRNLLAYGSGNLKVYGFSDSSITDFPGGGFLDWTPDGQSIVYADGIGKIFITDLQGSRREITGNDKPFFRPSGPVSVSPNNAQVLYEQTSNDFFRHIWVVNIDGSSARQFAQ